MSDEVFVPVHRAGGSAPLPAPGVLTVGETMALVTPSVLEPVLTASGFRVEAAGAESNVAAHVAALGHPARWFSRLGTDALGERVARQ